MTVPRALGSAVLVIVLALSAPGGAKVPRPGEEPWGQGLTVEVLSSNGWEPVGDLVFDRWSCEETLPLPGGEGPRPLCVRLGRPGATTAYVDAVELGGTAPLACAGDADRRVVAKLAEHDLDLLHLKGGDSVTLHFADATDSILRVRARIAPASQPVTPFNFPLANLYLNPHSFRSFYTHTVVESGRAWTVDGRLAEDELGAPLFQELIVPGSGHPPGATVAWVDNDAETLYAAIDFLPDNTNETEDFATLLVRGADGLRTFTIAENERRWGTSGFVGTGRAGYQHTVYEFAVPLAELAGSRPAPGERLDVAFSLYGTVAPLTLVDLFEAPAVGQTVDGSACTTAVEIPPPTTILGQERDLAVTTGTPTADVNSSIAGSLRADFSASAGTIELVLDGTDGDCSVLTTSMTIADLYSPGYDRVVLVGAANSGSAAVDVKVTLHTFEPVRAAYESVVKTVPAASGAANVPFVYAADFPGLSDPSELSAVAAVMLELSADTAGGVLAASSFVPSDGPVPVELESFTIDGG